MYCYAGARSNTGGGKHWPVLRTETRLQTQSLISSRIIGVGVSRLVVGFVLPFSDLLSVDTQSDTMIACCQKPEPSI